MILEVIARGLELERANPRFDPRNARPSAVGLCQLRHWADRVGVTKSEIPPVYAIAGHCLQHWYFINYVLPVCSDAEEEVEVPTVTGERTHPDFWLPSLKLAVQVKTSSETAVANKVKKAHHTAQVLIEWASWLRTGYCITRDGRRLYGAPERYEVLLLSRSTFGVTRSEIRVRWDAARAASLEARLLETQFCIETGIRPDRPYSKPTWECKNYETGELCPLHTDCWGDY